MRSIAGLGVCVVLGMAAATAQAAAPAAETPSKAWIAVSDAYTQQLLAVQLKHHPEGGSAEGLAQFDEQVSNPTLADYQAERSETEALLPKLKAAAATEQDKNVREDLAILQKAIDLQIRTEDYDEQHDIDFMNASEQIFGGLKTLLDDQVPSGAAERGGGAAAQICGRGARVHATDRDPEAARDGQDGQARHVVSVAGRNRNGAGPQSELHRRHTRTLRQVQADGMGRALREIENGAGRLRHVGANDDPAQGADRLPAAACRICACRLRISASTCRRRRLPPRRMRRLRNIRGRWRCSRRRSRRRMDGLRATTAM